VHIQRWLTRLFGVSLSLSVLAALPSSAAHWQARHGAQTPPPIYVGGRKIRTPAVVDHGHLLVPVRGVFEAIGASVQYSPPKFVVVRKDGAVIAAFILDRRRAIVGHESVDLDVAPTRRDGRVYVPLRVVAEAAGATVTYTNRPPSVRIRQPASDGGADDLGPAAESQSAQTAQWRIGVAVFAGLCCLGALVLAARRFARGVFLAVPLRGVVAAPHDLAVAMNGALPTAHNPPRPAREHPTPNVHVAVPDRAALVSVEATGEARLHKRLVTETRTIQVPVTREELVIEYAGEGGTVIVEGRRLAAGETVRIPLWEERVHVDVTKHVLVKEDIVIGKRRSTFAVNADRGQPLDFGVAEGSPS
jgi:uncharacterized protein (TIGR02271 family)